jgi:hypothetical protein
MSGPIEARTEHFRIQIVVGCCVSTIPKDLEVTFAQVASQEEKRMALAEAALEALVAPDREEMSVTDLLPQPKRRSRSA